MTAYDRRLFHAAYYYYAYKISCSQSFSFQNCQSRAKCALKYKNIGLQYKIHLSKVKR